MNLNDIQLHGVGVGGEITITFDNYNPTLPLLHHVTTPLSAARNDLAGASVGGYALFGGGLAAAVSAVVDAYNTDLTRSTPTALSAARQLLAGASVGGYALFGGGYTGAVSAVVDAYNTDLTRSTPTALSAARQLLAGASVGGYALFGGGHTGAAYSAVVDAYGAFFQTHVFSIGNKYNFRGIEIVTTQPVTNLSLPTPINGYIKYKKGGIIS